MKLKEKYRMIKKYILNKKIMSWNTKYNLAKNYILNKNNLS